MLITEFSGTVLLFELSFDIWKYFSFYEVFFLFLFFMFF